MLLQRNFGTTVMQVFFIILSDDVMIPCCYDVTVGGNAADFLNLSIFAQFFAHKCRVSSCIWQKVAKKKATSNILKSSLAWTVKVI